jgi:hypothetical protein
VRTNLLTAFASGGPILMMFTTVCSAGPCSFEIAAMQTRLTARLEAKAAAGPSAPESIDALRHHQPTPSSIAAAERKIGVLSGRHGKIIKESMARAREADRIGDMAACQQALDQIERTIAP